MNGHARIVALLLAAAPVATAAQEAGPLAPAAWLSGCWELRAGARTVLEMWMPAAGDAMLGASRTQVGGVTRDFEHLRISAAEGGLVYTASPARQATTAFASVHVSDTLMAFHNPEHDFPQRILYRRVGADSVVARVEGPGRDGPRGFDFPMARVACDAGGR